MNAPPIYLDRFPSFCQTFQNRWKFDKVLTKTNLLSFLGHGVYSGKVIKAIVTILSGFGATE